MSDSLRMPAEDVEARVAQIADEFVRQLDQGEQPSIGDFARRYPDLTAELRQALPALKLMRAAGGGTLSSVSNLAAALPLEGRLGDYHILRELGRGGMGIVYEAEQVSLGRRVALKVLPSVVALDAKQLQRFKNEAQAAAQLRHPNIVPVYGVGSEGNLHFYAMQLIDGRTLAGLIHDLRELRAKAGESSSPAPSEREHFRMVAEVGVQAAEALDHAHQLGILHRDIKPANLLVECAPAGTDHPRHASRLSRLDSRSLKLWVTDFGLARLRGDSDLTQTGDLLGTVRYMSPEQALGEHALVDQRADVYSLGVTLCELLTLEPAFGGADRAALLHQVAFDEPRPPRRLNPAIPVDLETIVLKSMAKNREERYLTARELADDLHRFLENRSIMARRPTPLQQAGKWAQRHRAVVTTAVVSAFVGMLAMTWLALSDRAQIKEKQTQTANALQMADEARRDLRRSLADAYTSAGLTAGDRGEAGQALLWFANAARLTAPGETADATRSELERTQANRQRFRFWSRQIPSPIMAASLKGPLQDWSFHPDGEHLLLVSQRGQCLMLDIRAKRAVSLEAEDHRVGAALWSPDGSRYVIGRSNGAVQVFAFPGGKRLQQFALPGAIQSLAFSMDGNLLAAGSDKVRVWDCRSAEFVTPELVHPQTVRHLAFNMRGDRLATACRDGLARVFALSPDATSASPLFAPLANLGRFSDRENPIKPLFVDQDRALIVRRQDGAVWCDAATGKEVRKVAAGDVNAIVPSNDGQHFVVCENFEAQLWSVNPPGPVGQRMVHAYKVEAAFSPDGQTLLTGSSFRVRHWSVPLGAELQSVPLLHQDAVTQIAFSPTGQFFATAQLDGLVRVCRMPSEEEDKRRLAYEGGMTYIRRSPDGRMAIPSGSGWWPNHMRRTRVYDIASGQPAGPNLEPGGLLTDAALSPDGTSAATVSSTAESGVERGAPAVAEGRAGRLQRWNWRTGDPLGDALPMPSEPRSVEYSPDGQRLVVLCGGGQGLLIDARHGRILKRLEHGGQTWSENLYSAVRFSPDGKTFVTSGLVPQVHLWDSLSGERRLPPLEHADHCRTAEFSNDGRWLVTASRDRAAHIWDVATGQLAAAPLVHPAELFGACFSPEGDRVLTACSDGMARVWNWRDGRLACPALRHGDVVCAAAFSPDGKLALVSDKSGKARLWELNAGKPLAPAFSAGKSGWFPMSAFFDADGARAVVAGQALPIPVFDLAGLKEPAELGGDDLVRLAELLSSYRLESGDITGLTAAEWLDHWHYFQKRFPALSSLQVGDSADWHRQQVQTYETAGNPRGTLWHLDRLIVAAPENAELHFQRGKAHAALSQWQPALAGYAEAIRIQPGEPDFYAHVAQAHVGAGDSQAAIADYTELIRLEPRNVRAYYERGSAHRQAKDHARAIADYQTLLKLDPSYHVHGTVWLFLAHAHHGLGEAAEARRRLNEAIAWFERAGKAGGSFQLPASSRLLFEQVRRETEALLAGSPGK
jgi:WD40 repeat protein/serine/threonine protein kinase/tetratricopeptide (TPR) repeat protein